MFPHVHSFWSLALLDVGSQQQEALNSGSQEASGRGDVIISRFPMQERHGNESGRRACQCYQSVTTLIKPSCVFPRIYELLRRHRQSFPVTEMTRSPSLPLPPEPSFSVEVLLEKRPVSADLAACRSTVLYSLLPYTNPFIRSRSSVKGLTVRYIYRYAAKVRHPNAFLTKNTQQHT